MSIASAQTTLDIGGNPDALADDHLPHRNDTNIDQRNALVLIGCGAAKRDPTDAGDLRVASTGPDEPLGQDWQNETGPAWKARDLYTSTSFHLKKQFAERVAGVDNAGRNGASPWAILSAEHHVLMPWTDVKPYDTSITDLGDDETNPDHRVENPYGLRRPDGREVVTELDQWTRLVAFGLMKWIASFRPVRDPPGTTPAKTLYILAGQDYITPLREKGVFEYGISRMAGDPNQLSEFPLNVRVPFEEFPNNGIGDQMSWLSDVVDRLGDPEAATEQVPIKGKQWSP